MATADSTTKPVSVLFVCLGNICRSTLAEGVFRHAIRHGQAAQDPRIDKVDSCGTGAYHTGDEPDSRTMSVLQSHGITGYTHAARKVRSADFGHFDYLMAMDKDNLRYLERERARLIRKGDLDESTAAKVQLFGVFGGKGQEEVIDPYYGGREGFETAYKQMLRFTEGFLAHLSNRDGS